MVFLSIAYLLILVVCMPGKWDPKCTKGGCGNYDVTPYIILILSLTFTPNAPGVGEGLRGVVWIWVIAGEECEVYCEDV